MPTTEGSPVRSRVVDTVRIIEATGLDVAHAGDQCALHVYTRAGIVKVLMPLHVFVEKARAPFDCNRNPFPKASLARQAVIEAELAEDAAALPANTPADERIGDDAPI